MVEASMFFSSSGTKAPSTNFLTFFLLFLLILLILNPSKVIILPNQSICSATLIKNCKNVLRNELDAAHCSETGRSPSAYPTRRSSISPDAFLRKVTKSLN